MKGWGVAALSSLQRHGMPAEPQPAPAQRRGAASPHAVCSGPGPDPRGASRVRLRPRGPCSSGGPGLRRSASPSGPAWQVLRAPARPGPARARLAATQALTRPPDPGVLAAEVRRPSGALTPDP
uniref:Uncharacterized protein n=1 Tax=Canis lupus dingo TaxID=286419 RepID=A0A8C0K893_CANLU